MRIAAAAWPLEWHRSWADYAAKLAGWVDDADADLLVFPEYAGMEAALIRPPARDTAQAWVEHAAGVAEDALALHVELARSRGVHLLMGSLPVRRGGALVNRAHLITPQGRVHWQDKQVPTPWERVHTTLAPGDPLAVAETDLGRIGILVCHDAEFPPLARALDCEILLVPACTDAAHGAARVRNAARARALENAAIAVLSQTVGDLADCVFLDANHGRAGIHAPPDRGFPGDGTLTESAPDAPGWARAQADMAALDTLRAGRGEVAIPLDWRAAESRAALRRGD